MTLRTLSTLLLGALLAGACSAPPETLWHGYVEGEFLYLAAPQAGYLARLDQPRGSRVAAGAPVFDIAADPDSQSLAAARARVEAARARSTNLQTPRRQTEIAALEAQVRAAASALALSQSRLAQQQALAGRGFVAQAALDEAIAARRRDAAALDAARQQLANYRDSLGRDAEIAGAEAEQQAAAAEAARQAWLVAHKQVDAPTAGEVADTYFQPGEWVGAGQPVASLLPDDKRRVRFFVPQAALPGLQPGDSVEVRCDGCGEAFRARIDFIAREAEYTPPVIYSEKMRAQLVFRVEAVPAPEVAPRLRPGQPVDVVAGSVRRG
ncbi:HlyD family secretion protein [Denitromonas iodatirespirans]|uniref:HlyD family efflux transporter periplasmic adaptor subunit n=1 Tax=Denitromonas iodatirespirans TaxID=2795389 RepID=A0A944DCN5_DENI1|nr:HlyD family efflux transporter periplasmic adaptor subunit [Denitromonas iodatirespirans]MBT0962616.1 HlyD family efflux transporter periplasmic adaptor subunit [Denitromonas iodatirespirans]